MLLTVRSSQMTVGNNWYTIQQLSSSKTINGVFTFVPRDHTFAVILTELNTQYNRIRTVKGLEKAHSRHKSMVDLKNRSICNCRFNSPHCASIVKYVTISQLKTCFIYSKKFFNRNIWIEFLSK